MERSSLAIALGIAALATSASSLAGDHQKDVRRDHRAGRGMQMIANPATTGEAAYGWRYFADRRNASAVVISPGGDYFYSRGAGLTLVFKGSPAPARA